MDLETIATYELYADLLIPKYEALEPLTKTALAPFLSMLSPNSLLLDLGSGPGVFAKIARTSGHDVLCIDASLRMAKYCHDLGFASCVADAETLPLTTSCIDGVIANALLVHIKRRNIPQVITELSRVCKPGAAAYFGILKGTGEGAETRDDLGPALRHFTYFEQDEMEHLLKPFASELRIEQELTPRKFLRCYMQFK